MNEIKEEPEGERNQFESSIIIKDEIGFNNYSESVEIKQESMESPNAQIKEDPEEFYLSINENASKKFFMPRREVTHPTVRGGLNKPTKSSKYQCDVCQKYFSKADSFKKHFELHYQLKSIKIEDPPMSKKFFCDQCERITSTKSSMAYHVVQAHLIYKVQCHICLKEVRPHQIRKHMKIVHETIEKKIKCKMCESSFKCISYLTHHMKYHNKKISCNYCDKKFANFNELNRHKVFHEYPEQLQCKICGHQSTLKSCYVLHMRTHTGHNKKFKCLVCHFKFHNSQIFRQHLGTHFKIV